MKISIVSTLYRSAAYLEEFLSRVVSSTEKLTKDFEIILVNDGSPDDSLELALRLKEHLPNVRIIDLSRNFGHHLAIMTGLSYAEGELVYLVDCLKRTSFMAIWSLARAGGSRDSVVAFFI